jgi:uncharacterized membrane protein YraQ (UPF0718 family)
MTLINGILHALALAGAMTWEVLWALILGFILSAIVQAVVRRSTISKHLGDDKPRTLLLAAGLGAASSSCSYAAVALARSLFRKGASFTAAMAFEIASTNLVIELGIILALLIGWQFTLAEFIGGPIMIVLLAVFFRLFLRKKLVEDALLQANIGLAGSMEGHAAMDMSVAKEGTFWQRLLSREGYTSVSHIFVMEWAAVLKDIVIGLLIAGAIGAWVPNSFWEKFFLTDHVLLSKIWGPIIGPLVAVASFVCSIGNVPLAGILWNGGISFGGVISFIFADLIIFPIINIYRKYYGLKMAVLITGGFYLTMVLAGYVIELLFAVIHLTPTVRAAKVVDASISWNYTSFLNIAFLLIAGALVYKFIKSDGMGMMGMMHGGPDDMSHEHEGHHC